MTENYSKQPSPDGIVFRPHPKDKRFKDRTGDVHGYLTILGFAGKRESAWNPPQWWVKCVCGTIKKVLASNLNHDRVSCGCKTLESISLTTRRHGMSTSPEYKAWSTMKARCMTPQCQVYKYYGGRGIKVCDRWLESFENFLEDMGRKPEINRSLDRIDVNGNYDPGNCRWATPIEQGRNMRTNRVEEFNGKRQCVSAWEQELGFRVGQLEQRLHHGWTMKEAIETPFNTRSKRTIQPSQKPCTDQLVD